LPPSPYNEHPTSARNRESGPVTEPARVADRRPPRRLAAFQITKQHRRFVEFADAVRRHR
ncbi:MAG TPA: hypothetical protein VII33_00450, partial [Nakamurella sp.]